MGNGKLPFRKAVFYIFAVTVVIFGIAFLAMVYYFHIKESQKQDPAFNLAYIEQQGELPTAYLVELMGLSQDESLNLHEFDLSEIEKKMCESPLIKNAVVSKIFPNACFLDYSMRKPVVRLSDWENAALDEEGVMVPIHPFFKMDKLPVVTLGAYKRAGWGKKIKSPRTRLALDLIKHLSFNEIDRIDVSRIELPSFGSREIVIVLEKKIVRLSPDDWENGWSNFQQMEQMLPRDEHVVVDLRIKDLAFIQDPG